MLGQMMFRVDTNTIRGFGISNHSRFQNDIRAWMFSAINIDSNNSRFKHIFMFQTYSIQLRGGYLQPFDLD